MTKVSGNTEDSVRDVVCGMTIAKGEAAGFSAVGDVNYYFCSLPCKGRFDADPGRYVDDPSGQSPTLRNATSGQIKS